MPDQIESQDPGLAGQRRSDRQPIEVGATQTVHAHQGGPVLRSIELDEVDGTSDVNRQRRGDGNRGRNHGGDHTGCGIIMSVTGRLDESGETA